MQYANEKCKALGKNNRVCGVYSSEPYAEVYCVRLNFNISKLVYYFFSISNGRFYTVMRL